ncbi:hypothetical protein GCM10020331_040610 [Ectobacillus funiculus]
MVVAFFTGYTNYLQVREKNSNSSYNRAAKQSKRKYAKPNVTPLNKKIVFRRKEQKKASLGLLKKEAKAIPFNCH